LPAARGPQTFADWLAGFRKDALAAGIRPATVDRALTGVQPIQRVIDLDHRQPENVLTFNQYVTRAVSDERVRTGRRKLAENRALLEAVSARYGVPSEVIVALWGLETGYGSSPGTYPVIDSLATLAFDGRRSAFFRSELIDALRIIDRNGIAPDAMRGSWAGAMGQTQFMPSSYLKFAVSYAGDAPPDIWSNRADVFASIANYLAKSGWNGAESWGQTVELPTDFPRSKVASKPGEEMPTDSWRALGVRTPGNHRLRADPTPASLIQPAPADAPTLLVTGNYRVILKWNHSMKFATAVSYLADQIGN
jgi:membrane-bound lytic murein transglycosylase B